MGLPATWRTSFVCIRGNTFDGRRALTHAIHVGRVTALDLDLDRGVRDVEAMFDVLDHGAQDLLTLTDALLGHEDVAAARNHTGADPPHMEIVDVDHANHALDGRDEGRHVPSSPRSL